MVLPMLLVLTFFTLEGAHYIWNEHKVVMGVRDAVRYASRLDFTHYSCPAATYVPSPSGVPTVTTDMIANLARTGQISGGTAKVSGWTNSDITVSITCIAGTGGLYGVVGGNAPIVTVSTNVLYPSLLGSTLGFSTSMRLGAVAESAVMGI